MRFKLDKYTLFYNYTTLIFIYAVGNGLFISSGSVLTIIIPSIFVLYSSWINIKYSKYLSHNKIIYIYIIYIAILVYFSSNIPYSLKNVLKSFVPLFYFGVAIAFVNNYKALNRLFKSMIILGILFIANLIISNLFNLGGSSYSADETDYLQTGSIYSEGLNSMGYYLILLPAIIQLYPFKRQYEKRIVLLMCFAIFISLLLVLKRGSLLIVFSGYIILLLFSQFKQRKRLIKTLLFSALALVLSFPLYEKMLYERINVRQDRLQLDSYESELRHTENELVIKDIFYSGNKVWLFFGHEVLNSAGNYGGGVYRERQLHNDYAQLLNGSGIIGLSLYFLMNISILTYYLKLRKKILCAGLYGKKERLLNMVFWAFFLVYFILGFSGSIDSLIYNPIRFIFLGAIIGIFKNIACHVNLIKLAD